MGFRESEGKVEEKRGKNGEIKRRRRRRKGSEGERKSGELWEFGGYVKKEEIGAREEGKERRGRGRWRKE